MYMILLFPRTSLNFKTKSLQINHVTSLHITTLHLRTVHSVPTSIPCPVVVFDKLTSQTVARSNGRIVSGMTLRDWLSSSRRFGETWCLHLRCFNVPRYFAEMVTPFPETSPITYPTLKRHIPVDSNPRRRYLKSRNSG